MSPRSGFHYKGKGKYQEKNLHYTAGVHKFYNKLRVPQNGLQVPSMPATGTFQTRRGYSEDSLRVSLRPAGGTLKTRYGYLCKIALE